ncbi:MAG: agmatinase [Candidatus Thermoplasmatota archaeon]|nr:agmatinase [Candidatus Thermoplasmatota archaeon]
MTEFPDDPSKILFADATSNLEEADYVILGVSYEGTACHRKGTAEAPYTVREESYNFETYRYRYEVDVENVKIYDMGTQVPRDYPQLVTELRRSLVEILNNDSFPIIIGGEHSISPIIVAELHKRFSERPGNDLKVVSIDAHLDFRDSFLGDRNSHACSTRRIGDIVGYSSTLCVGVRSFERKEMAEAKDLGLKWLDSFSVRESGIETCIREIERFIGDCPVYLTVDMDGIDPAFAPGVGTPEPFGLTHWDVLSIIEALSPSLVGLDIVEIYPPYDNGNTSALASKLIGDMIAVRERN